MARVLFAWEFGGDLGHAHRIVPVARALRALGHEPLFAFRDLTLLGGLAGEGFEWFAAPQLRPPDARNPSPLNASDILLNLGYADPAALGGALRAWQSLFSLTSPALVVADYAPTALLAARVAKLARVTIGTGFSLPLKGNPLPALRAWHPAERETLERLDARLVDNVGRAFDRISAKASAPRTAWEVFDARAHLLCTFPELDPFGPREGVEYVGPQGDADAGVEARWSDAGAPRVFAYLKPRDARFTRMVQALCESGVDALVAAPGLDKAEAAALSGDATRVFAEPLRLDPLLAGAHLCITHAGPGVAARALAAGVPLALLPMQLEQYLVAARLVDAGIALMVLPEAEIPDPRAWIEAALANESLRPRARSLAEAHAGYRFDEAAARTAQRIAAELG